MRNTDMHPENAGLRAKYRCTAWFYDILDYPWERQYRKWRPALLGDVHGEVLEAGVGTGHNLASYPPDANVTAIDLSDAMLASARRRARKARCSVELSAGDATRLEGLPADHFDWYIATFLYCVMPDGLQPEALAQIARVLKPGGRFRLLEIVYSRDPRIRRRQQFLAPLVQRVYGARFDRGTLHHLRAIPGLEVTRTSFLKDDTYLLIDGRKVTGGPGS
jgi:ubiquinone/menaquinone biosynthesis C-methylase UbiE